MNRSILLAPAAVLALALPCAAQVTSLNSYWFRLEVKAKVQAIDGLLEAEPAQIKTTAYLHLEQGELPGDDVGLPGPVYDWEIWTEQDGGWAVSDTGTDGVIATTDGDQIFPDLDFDLHLKGGVFVSGRATLSLHVTTNAQQLVTKVRVRTLGGQCVNGSTDGVDFVVGGLALKGKWVYEIDLPFVDPD